MRAFGPVFFFFFVLNKSDGRARITPCCLIGCSFEVVFAVVLPFASGSCPFSRPPTHPFTPPLSFIFVRRQHFGAARGHVRVVEMLISAGAAIEIKSRDGKTPLDFAQTNIHVRRLLEVHSQGMKGAGALRRRGVGVGVRVRVGVWGMSNVRSCLR